ncbi:MAG: hypothetical protein JF609_04710 [Verrucomicrobia bacterium]|nr:hypothetical protein [Verrucomicrobiota bacterium]
MKIFFYLSTFVFGFLGSLVSLAAVEQAVTGGHTSKLNILAGVIFLLIALASWQKARKESEDES